MWRKYTFSSSNPVTSAKKAKPSDLWTKPGNSMSIWGQNDKTKVIDVYKAKTITFKAH